MNKIVKFLKSEKPAFIFSIFLMVTYSINLSILMKVVGHLDFGHFIVDRTIYFLTALAIESLMLVFVINHMVWVGRGYAIFSLLINLLYYNHFDLSEWRNMAAAVTISIVHSGAIFFLAELFKTQTKEDNVCQVCETKFATSSELNMHLRRVHRKKTKK
jgi:hypothetical protein